MIGRWSRGTRLLVAATAAWAAFLVLHVTFSGRWWAWGNVEIMPPVTVVAVPLLLLLLVPFARPVRRPLSVLLVLLLLAGGHLAGYGHGWTGSALAGARSTTIKVFSWNTAYWEMENDPDAFYAFLRRQNADVYLLQEHLYALRKSPYNEVISIDDSARLRAEFPGYRLAVETEFVTLSRLPIVAAHRQPIPRADDNWFDDGWFWNGPKYQRTEIRVGGRTVDFYNVHLPSPFRWGDPLDPGFYPRQARQARWRFENLRRLRADVARSPHPSVMAGDFNSPWTELYAFRRAGEAHGPPGVAPPRTWPVSLASGYHLPALWRLDWLFTTGDLAVPGYRLVAGAEGLSDHAAQEFRLAVPDAQEGRA